MKKLLVYQALEDGPASRESIQQITGLGKTYIMDVTNKAKRLEELETLDDLYRLTALGRKWLEMARGGTIKPHKGRTSNYVYITSQTRPCMCCGRTFESEGKHNRLCLSCKDKSDALPQVTVHV